MAYNREACRAYLSATSAKQKKRIYKVVMVLDLDGMTFTHFDRRYLQMTTTASTGHMTLRTQL